MKKGKFTAYAGLFLEQFVDVRYVVERIVDEEFEFGYNAQLVPHVLSQLEADSLDVGVDVGEQLFGFLRGEYAEIRLANAQVGTYAAFAYRHNHAARCARLFFEYGAQLLLQQPGYLVLSCGFHRDVSLLRAKLRKKRDFAVICLSDE